jgi:hypothetical protein
MAEKLSSGPKASYDLTRVGSGLSRGPNLQKKATAAAWSNTWPAPGATLDLDFANNRGFVRGVGQGGAMDAVTFTRASNGWYVDNTGTLQQASNNAPRFDWASTASTGAGTIASPYVIPLQANPTCNGLLIEESRTNRLLWCRDATQTNWTKTNVTAAKNQTGIDGVANAASSLTASSANGTCIQTVTLASGSRTGSVYLKRITGTGNIQVTLDGSTWSTVDLSNGLWNRIVLSGTVTNPTVGILIATSGDAVVMDYGQVEDGALATTPILTTTASATRAADVASVTGQKFSGFYSRGPFQLYTKFTTPNTNNNGYYAGANISSSFSNEICPQIRQLSSGSLWQLRVSNSTINLLSYTTTLTSFSLGLSISRDAYTFAAADRFFSGVTLSSTIFDVQSSLQIGYQLTNTSYLNGCVSRIVYIPKAGAADAVFNAARQL